jgi:hypothetical protein
MSDKPDPKDEKPEEETELNTKQIFISAALSALNRGDNSETGIVGGVVNSPGPIASGVVGAAVSAVFPFLDKPILDELPEVKTKDKGQENADSK